MTQKTKRLADSNSAYLLWVPFAEKERAKQIEGYRWDGQQKCWVFPKTQRAYDAIVSEFGDELENQVAPQHGSQPAPAPQASSAPQPPVEPPTAASLQELSALKSQLQELQSQLQLQTALRERAEAEAATARQQTVDANAKLIARESRPDVAALLKQSKDAMGRVAELQSELARVREALSAEQRTRATFEKEASEAELYFLGRIQELEGQARSKVTGADLHSRMVNLAVKASGNDADFAALVADELVQRGLEVKITAALSKALCALLKTPAPSNDLFEIITAARTQQVLALEDGVLADTIRRQRNTLAHQDLPKDDVRGRLFVILFAAALLWPKLQKSEAASSAQHA